MLSSPFTVGALVFALALSAGSLPLFLRFGERVLHGVIAAACGLFLGITFLHLLPELSAKAALRNATPAIPGASTPAVLWGCVLAGVLAVFCAEVLLRSKEDEQHEGDHPAHHGGHRVVGIATFVGLTVHTFGGAMGIGLAFDDQKVRDAFVLATVAHKSAEAFSLASVLLLAELSRRAIFGLLTAYALVTPVGIFVGSAIGQAFERGFAPSVLGPAEGLAAGTFLYVALGELLPEIFHGRSDRLWKIVLLLAGIAVSTTLLLSAEGGTHP